MELTTGRSWRTEAPRQFLTKRRWRRRGLKGTNGGGAEKLADLRRGGGRGRLGGIMRSKGDMGLGGTSRETGDSGLGGSSGQQEIQGLAGPAWGVRNYLYTRNYLP